MSHLLDVYTHWQAKPFPAGSPDDAVDELHADLALADSWIADTVIPFVRNGVYQPAKLDVLGSLDGIIGRTTELRADLSQDDQARLSAYRDYASVLREVYAAFLQEGGRNSSS